MIFTTLPNGNLEITMEPADKDEIQELVDKNPDDRNFMVDLMEYTGWSPNGQLYVVDAKDVGGLTDAPILTDDMTIEENGDISVHGTVWWYPNYAVTHCGKELLSTGRTVFTVADPVS